jgi:hypothetical protein
LDGAPLKIAVPIAENPDLTAQTRPKGVGCRRNALKSRSNYGIRRREFGAPLQAKEVDYNSLHRERSLEAAWLVCPNIL